MEPLHRAAVAADQERYCGYCNKYRNKSKFKGRKCGVCVAKTKRPTKR